MALLSKWNVKYVGAILLFNSHFYYFLHIYICVYL